MVLWQRLFPFKRKSIQKENLLRRNTNYRLRKRNDEIILIKSNYRGAFLVFVSKKINIYRRFTTPKSNLYLYTP